MDSPNRLNVSITRARYQMIVVGHYEYFSKRSRTDELRNLAKSCVVDKSIEPARINKKKDWNGKK
jgi:superfamily I DNA and/or RNA helicase